MIIVLDSVRSAHNVGSIFRTADAVGVQKIYLCGVTPTPQDRFGRPSQRIAKVSLGAEHSVNWEHSPDVSIVIKKLQADSYRVIALEQQKGSSMIWDMDPVAPDSKIALVLGSEVDGLSTAALALADKTIEIPMHGKKESLNVSVAFGIAIYWLLRPRS